MVPGDLLVQPVPRPSCPVGTWQICPSWKPALLLPAAAFVPPRIDAPERFLVPSHPEPAPRNDVSLAPVAAFFRSPPREVTAPRLLLRPTSRIHSRPVRFAAPGLAPRLQSLPRGRSVLRSRCRMPIRNSLPGPQPSLCLGVFTPQLQRACRRQPRWLTLTLSSISVRSPLLAPFYRRRLGSSFPVRCCLPGLLFLLTSWNLLNNAPETRRSQ